MQVTFECQGCGQEFSCDAGRVSIDQEAMRPVFEKAVVCPRCGVRTLEQVILTELSPKPRGAESAE